MIINSIKKTQVLFNKLKQTADKEEGKAYSDANPFFSWHANHITVDRKKVIILVNDLTLLPLLINDVNAKVKPDLDKVIETGIREMFSLIGISDDDINLYFKHAGEIEINAAYNRKTLGHINNYLYSFEEIDLRERYPFELCLFLAGIPQMKLEKYNSIEKTLETFSNGITVNNYTKENYQIEKSWEPFSQWSKYADKDWFEDYDKVAEQVKENNSKMLASFESYLLNKENMSKPRAVKYVSALTDFTDLYLLYYRIGTVLTDMADVIDFLSDFYVRKFMWASKSDLQNTSRALKKLYTFLYEADEISADDLKLVKLNIREGTEEGLEHLTPYLD